MIPAILTLIAVLAGPLGNVPIPFAVDAPDVVEAADSQAPSEPTILEVAGDDIMQPDGLRGRWASVTYDLSSGHEAEVFIEVDELGRAEGLV